MRGSGLRVLGCFRSKRKISRTCARSTCPPSAHGVFNLSELAPSVHGSSFSRVGRATEIALGPVTLTTRTRRTKRQGSFRRRSSSQRRTLQRSNVAFSRACGSQYPHQNNPEEGCFLLLFFHLTSSWKLRTLPAHTHPWAR